MIVTIDGPAGAGKSSSALAVAERLQFDFLDTGAMYRGVALAALRKGCDLGDVGELQSIALTCDLRFVDSRLLLDGEDVSEAIRQAEVTAAAGELAVHGPVRDALVEKQRRYAAKRNIVAEGRDQGTVVFPNAQCKFFLTADDDARVERRYRELLANGQTVERSDVQKAMQIRDKRDRERAVAPLQPAQDAVIIDSTKMTLAEVVEQIVSHVQTQEHDS